MGLGLGLGLGLGCLQRRGERGGRRRVQRERRGERCAGDAARLAARREPLQRAQQHCRLVLAGGEPAEVVGRRLG